MIPSHCGGTDSDFSTSIPLFNYDSAVNYDSAESVTSSWPKLILSRAAVTVTVPVYYYPRMCSDSESESG